MKKVRFNPKISTTTIDHIDKIVASKYDNNHSQDRKSEYLRKFYIRIALIMILFSILIILLS